MVGNIELGALYDQLWGFRLIQSSLITPPLRPGTLGLIDNYELIRVLGEGGMGVVYLAKSLSSASSRVAVKGAPPVLEQRAQPPGCDSRFVVVKTLRPDLAGDSRAIAHFRKEVGHMAKLRHPQILPVLALSDCDRGTYLVLPYMREGSLERFIKAGLLDTPAITRIATQIASALCHAHSRGIIHRDISPRNILLDSERNAYLTDFGLSHSTSNDDLTEPDKLLIQGNLPYLSPAAARGECEGNRVDLYAFGALLYEMLTGLPPYRAATREALLAAIQNGPPPRITALNPQAEPRLVRVAERAMGRELHRRYAAMSYALADLATLRNGPPARRWFSIPGVKGRLSLEMLHARIRLALRARFNPSRPS